MREKIAAKIKQMRVSYRKALDYCKQSGGGRVVATFFDLCNQILSGSPATESMSSGLDGAVDSTDAHSLTLNQVLKIQHFKIMRQHHLTLTLFSINRLIIIKRHITNRQGEALKVLLMSEK